MNHEKREASKKQASYSTLLWTEQPRARSPRLGTNKNDKARRFIRRF